MRIRILSLFVVFILFPASILFGASIEKAGMLNRHGLIEEAKAELIDVIFSKTTGAKKAQAYYLLGGIAFDEKRISVALDSWRELSKKYPESSQAKMIKDRLRELAEIVGESEKESIQNTIASSYLRHGDFWSRDKDEKFTIDTSWLPHVEAAVKWYDKVISEFPKSPAARIAYQNKLRALLGWAEGGRYGVNYGVKLSYEDYIPQVVAAFTSFEKDYPNASSLQAFRYQIAQAHWKNKEWDEARKWLSLIIEKAGNDDSFYKDLAQRRLNKVEY